MYDTAVCIAISSACGCDIYANLLEKYHQKQHHMKILYSLCVVHTQYILFDALEFQKDTAKTLLRLVVHV